MEYNAEKLMAMTQEALDELFKAISFSALYSMCISYVNSPLLMR